MLTTILIGILIACISFAFLRRRPKSYQKPRQSALPRHLDGILGLDILIAKILSVVPENVVLPSNDKAFKACTDSHWASQERDSTPLCIFRPASPQQLAGVIRLIKDFYLERNEDTNEADEPKNIFAIRAGGHSPVSGAASTDGGILIDLGLLTSVALTDDRSTVQIGGGCRWGDVSKILDEQGLAVVGGRNSAVGVGGLTLGGGLSFFSPQFGMVCSNIIEYQVVLASGTVVLASETSHSDLWRALKGGGNNFGIVTNFTARCFPCDKIWSGFLYLPSMQTQRVLRAFHDYVERGTQSGSDRTQTYDECSAGPLTSFTYVPALGMIIIAVNLVHTSPPQEPCSSSSLLPFRRGSTPWPECWDKSLFKSLFRLWSTTRLRSLTDATDELNRLNLGGRRQTFGVTTVKNDPPTLRAAHEAYLAGIRDIKAAKLQDVMFTLVLQPLLPEWARKGDPNPLGFSSSSNSHDDRRHGGSSKYNLPSPQIVSPTNPPEEDNDPLVIASFTVNWADANQDVQVKSITRAAVEHIEAFAIHHETAHRYKYLNYCAEWQDPFRGYGRGEKEWLREVSKTYDPDGLFQKACRGGFKLFDSEYMDVVGHGNVD